MKLTPERKAHIDGLPQIELLRKWRYAPAGNSWMEGETGEYWGKRLGELQKKDPQGHTRASKQIGWER
jgi:hypothetical protein